MVSVFQKNRVRIHVKFVFVWKTVRLFPMQTKRKHNKIIPSVFTQKWKTVWFFVFYNESNGLSFSDTNRWNNFIMFSLCLHRKQFTCFPCKHELYMYSNPVFLEYRDHPQQCQHLVISLCTGICRCSPVDTIHSVLWPSQVKFPGTRRSKGNLYWAKTGPLYLTGQCERGQASRCPNFPPHCCCALSRKVKCPVSIPGNATLIFSSN